MSNTVVILENDGENDREIEFSLKSSSLHPVFGPLFTPYPLFEWGLQRLFSYITTTSNE